FRPRCRAASLALLAVGRGYARDIRCTHSPRESLVHSQVGALRKPVARNSTNVLRGQCLTADIDPPPRRDLADRRSSVKALDCWKPIAAIETPIVASWTAS